MAKQQVTLYIDDSSISVLVSRGRQPQKWSTVPLERGLVKEGIVQDQAAVAAKLKELWRTSGILRRRVTLGISGINCLYQLLLLPELPVNLRAEAISREATHSLGISLESVYISYQVLAIEHGQMQVYLAVVPRDKIDTMVATLKMAGLRAVAMDVRPLCLARVSSEPRAIIIDTRRDCFDIVVLSDGIPEVVRSLYVAPETPPGDRIALVRSELDRAVSFYNAAHPDKPLDLKVPILVSGDLAGQDSDKAAIAGPRERPVRDMESPFSAQEGFEEAKYMTCIGLALKEILVTESGAVSYSLVNFNVLPEKYQVRKRPLAEVLWMPTVLAGVVLIGMGIWGITDLKAENRDLVAQRDGVNRRMQEQVVTTRDIDTLTRSVTAAEGSANALNGLLSSLDQARLSTVEDLELVWGRAADAGVSLDTVATTATGMVVSGSAATEDQMFRYGRAILDSGRFSSVMIGSISSTEEGVTFSMSLGR